MIAYFKSPILRAVLGLAVITSLPGCGPSDSMEEETILENLPIPPTNNKTAQFREPHPTPEEQAEILARYSYIDIEKEVPKNLLREALIYYETNKSVLGNTSVLTIIDFSAFSGVKRFHIIDMFSGDVTSTYVAHGKNSDPNWTGYSTSFSNKEGSYKSSLGFYLTEETYNGAHGYSMRLDGLSVTNSNARERAIVLHSANYVREHDDKPGRSLGCPAIPTAQRDYVINRIKGGSLIFAGLSGA